MTTDEDYIFVRSDLHAEPRIQELAERLNLSKSIIIGALLRIWIEADTQSADGLRIPGMTPEGLNTMVGPFGEALVETGWIRFDQDGLQVMESSTGERHGR